MPNAWTTLGKEQRTEILGEVKAIIQHKFPGHKAVLTWKGFKKLPMNASVRIRDVDMHAGCILALVAINKKKDAPPATWKLAGQGKLSLLVGYIKGKPHMRGSIFIDGKPVA